MTREEIIKRLQEIILDLQRERGDLDRYDDLRLECVIIMGIRRGEDHAVCAALYEGQRVPNWLELHEGRKSP